MSRRLRTYLLAGLIVVLPTIVSLYAIVFMFNVLDSWFRSLMDYFFPLATWSFAGVGALISVTTILLVGRLATSMLGRRVLALNDWLFLRMPLVKTVYKTVKQLTDAFLRQGHSAFQQVVLLEYPRPGLWAIGFITSPVKGEIAGHLSDSMVSVFIPTTPNPTSGVLVLAHKDEVKYLKMSVESGIKLIISGGIFAPPSDEAEVGRKGFDDET